MSNSRATLWSVLITAIVVVGACLWAWRTSPITTADSSAGVGLQVRLEAPDSDPQSTVDIVPGPGGAQFRVRRPVLFDNADVASAHVGQSPEGTRQVVVVWTPYAADRFLDITSSNLHRHLAVYFDGQLMCTPTILTPVRDALPIDYGRNGFTLEKATQIVGVLNSRAVPATAGQ